MNEPELPREVSRGVLNIGPFEVEVVYLDDGRRLITAEGLAQALNWLVTGQLPDSGRKPGDE